MLSSITADINARLATYEPWKLVVGGAGVTLAGVALYNHYFADLDLKDALFKQIRNIPGVSGKIQDEHVKIAQKIRQTVSSFDDNPLSDLPEEGLSHADVIQVMTKLKEKEGTTWKDGYVSGAVYSGADDLVQLSAKAYELFCLANPLHLDLFPAVRKFEAEIVRFTRSMLNGDEGVCGVVTSGGTESLLMACKAYRDQALAKKGIKHPEIVLPVTAHCAFDKAAHYFGIKLVKIPVKSDFKVDMAALEGAITKNTIALIGSAPGYPHGTIDDISGLSDLAIKYSVPLHVDMCLGGFILPWAKREGWDLPEFDFSLPGVTSISADTHKYAFAPKGTSALLFRNKDIRHYMFFVATEWPGGIYPSPTMPGSRPGGAIAAAWAVMMVNGKKGYLDSSNKIMQTAKDIKEGLRAIREIKLMGDSLSPIIAWDTIDSINIYNLNDYMSEKGWNLSALHKPKGLHLCVTLRQVGKVDKFLADIKDSIELVKKNPTVKNGSAPVYGMCASLPDRGLIKEITWTYMDALLDA